jgi:cytochrome c oxidase cbb3-type subunit 3
VKNVLSLLACVMAAAALAGCKDNEAEQQPANNTQTAAAAAEGRNDTEPRVALVPFSPGAQKPIVDTNDMGRKLMNDPQQIASGKQLFAAMNCNGCHFNGGGGMGPPLMDSVWIYGGSIENIAASIREGRPNGMPSFRGFLPEEQVWQVAAYVRSLSQDQPGTASAEQPPK